MGPINDQLDKQNPMACTTYQPKNHLQLKAKQHLMTHLFTTKYHQMGPINEHLMTTIKHQMGPINEHLMTTSMV